MRVALEEGEKDHLWVAIWDGFYLVAAKKGTDVGERIEGMMDILEKEER